MNKKKYYYTLNVPAGIYKSNNIITLLFKMFKHRCFHLIQDKKWID